MNKNRITYLMNEYFGKKSVFMFRLFKETKKSRKAGVKLKAVVEFGISFSKCVDSLHCGFDRLRHFNYESFRLITDGNKKEYKVIEKIVCKLKKNPHELFYPDYTVWRKRNKI